MAMLRRALCLVRNFDCADLRHEGVRRGDTKTEQIRN